MMKIVQISIDTRVHLLNYNSAFYSDYETLSALFHPEFEFSDPAFPDLKGL